MLVLLIFAEEEVGVLILLVTSTISGVLCRVKVLGDSGFLGTLAFAETHLYLEALGSTVTGLSFLGSFLALARLNTVGEPPLAAAVFVAGVGETFTVLLAGGEITLLFLDSSPPISWLFTQVNFDLVTEAWLGMVEGNFVPFPKVEDNNVLFGSGTPVVDEAAALVLSVSGSLLQLGAEMLLLAGGTGGALDWAVGEEVEE